MRNMRRRSMMERLGQQLGNYRLTRLLGQGGFAEVYLGEHPVLGTTVAIKVLHTQVMQENVALFQQEAHLLASLRHPHIVRILDFGVDKRIPYLVMDYTPNGTLRTRHARGTRLPVSTVIGYVQQIAEALQYAHDHKVVHRDVKPENMLIGEHGEILLSDFGIALIAHSSHYQSVRDLAGTIAYMAPEQIQAHPRPASDQYSLGIVAYEWLCGTCPFHGTFPEIAVKHSVTPPPLLREHLPTLLPDVEQVILMALAKQPEERFVSVRTFAAALEQASQDMLPTQQLRPKSISSPVPTPSSLSDAVTAPPISEAVLTPPSNQPFVSSVRSTTPSNPPVTQAPPTLHNLPTPTKTTSKPIVSRRAVLIGVAGVVAMAAVGVGIYSILQQRSSGSVGTPPNPTVTPRYQPFTYTGHTDSVRAVAWSPDGKRIVSASFDGTVRVLNASDGSEVFIYTGHTDSVWSVAWSPDGKRIASGSRDNTAQVWNASDGSHVFTYTGHASNDVNTVAWSPDGKLIASGSDDKMVQVWNASDGSHVFTYTGHTELMWSVAWSPDGKWIASGSRDNTVQVWNARGGNKVFTYQGHSGTVKAVAWSPDGKRIVSGSDDKTAQVWNASDGSSSVFIYKGHTNTVWSVAWSPDGKQIASGSLDKTVQVWNAGDGNNMFTYKGHTDLVGSVAWSPYGKWIASGSSDKTVQVWSVG
jgi:serine/threonine protein kinase/Tol biopolymer transport system component